MYTELQVTTNFSFLRGASHPEELMEQAAVLGYKAIGIADRNSFAGIVRAHVAARKNNIRLIPGCRLDLQDGISLLAYPLNRKGYAHLCQLLTTGNLRAEKGECLLYKKDVYEGTDSNILIALPPENLVDGFELDEKYKQQIREYQEVFGDRFYLAANKDYRGDDAKRIYRLSQLGVKMVATGDVHYHIPERRQLQDVVTCIREKCTIYTAGYRLHPNAERHLKSPEEMIRLFRSYPAMVSATQEIRERCCFSLDELKYEYPEEITSESRTPQQELALLSEQGARERFGEQVPEKIRENIRKELHFIEQMNYAPYFLTVYDIVRFARSRGILCQGRGSAANSTICYCLGITSVDPTKFDLLFERFISAARNEPPDIDVDFEHERREEVIQYIYEKYGRDRAAIVATVTQQHFKGAVRDVGKAMGLSVDTVRKLRDEQIAPENLHAVQDLHLRRTLELTYAFMGFPRQLGQHTGGFVITRTKLSELCPVLNARMENRTCIEWNKDDIDALGFLKVDILALGMLTCIRKAFELAEKHYGLHLTLANTSKDDPAVYEMISRADTIGVFQIESRAQQSMLPRLKPSRFYDLVIEVAIVRPGPIQGDMVHPYLRRKNNQETITYPSKELQDILERTLGVPLFQEQAMKIAIVAAGFTPTEADELRRSMATFKVNGMVSRFRDKLINGMVARNYDRAYAERVFRQLEGFGSYGFPESHAVSFALLAYVSSWLKYYYPDVFTTALLNSYPMGFYQPAQLISDARNHGVEVRPADVNYSEWDHTLEEQAGKYRAIRLGFRLIRGLSQKDMEQLIAARGTGFTSLEAVRDSGISQGALERLADADAFRSLGIDRRKALWQLSAKDHPVALFQGKPRQEENISLPQMTLPEHVVQDYATTSVSLKAHPLSFVREKLSMVHAHTASAVNNEIPHGQFIRTAGLVLVRQRPGTAKGVCFITLEDETGTVNLIVFQKIFDAYRKQIIQAKLLMVEGKLQKEGAVVHVVVEKCFNLNPFLRKLIPREQQMAGLPEGRNFK